jgi:hypothetical protein
MSGQDSKGQERLRIRSEEYRRRSILFGKTIDIARNRLNLDQQLTSRQHSQMEEQQKGHSNDEV